MRGWAWTGMKCIGGGRDRDRGGRGVKDTRVLINIISKQDKILRRRRRREPKKLR